MIKLTENDREKLYEYIEKEPEMNLFIYGDIENYGIDQDPVSIYAFTKNNQWDAVLLKYFNFYILYSQSEDYDEKPVVEFLKEAQFDCLSGKTVLLKKIAPYFQNLKLQSTYMSRLDRINENLKNNYDNKTYKIRLLNETDIDDIAELYIDIEEFINNYKDEKASENSKIRMAADMKSGNQYFGMFDDDKLISIASISAGNSRNAMITGVATHCDYRRKGWLLPW